MDKLDKKVMERHAQELADLQRRQSSADASNGAPAADVTQLADNLYDTKLSAGSEKVSKTLLGPLQHPVTTLVTHLQKTCAKELQMPPSGSQQQMWGWLTACVTPS